MYVVPGGGGATGSGGTLDSLMDAVPFGERPKVSVSFLFYPSRIAALCEVST